MKTDSGIVFALIVLLPVCAAHADTAERGEGVSILRWLNAEEGLLPSSTSDLLADEDYFGEPYDPFAAPRKRVTANRREPGMRDPGTAAGRSFGFPGLGHLYLRARGSRALGVIHFIIDGTFVFTGLIASAVAMIREDADGKQAATYVIAGVLGCMLIHRIECALESLLWCLLLNNVRRSAELRRRAPPGTRFRNRTRFVFGIRWPAWGGPLIDFGPMGPSYRMVGDGMDLGVEFDLAKNGLGFAGMDVRLVGGNHNANYVFLPFSGFINVHDDHWFQVSVGPYLGTGKIVYALVRAALSYELFGYEEDEWRMMPQGRTGINVGLGVGVRCSVRTSIQLDAAYNFPFHAYEGERIEWGSPPVAFRSGGSPTLSLGVVFRM
ncbi:MAG: hypothetical protein ACYTHN_12805 [Planctomycetota bacterium]|jgi:hypothetical protein